MSEVGGGAFRAGGDDVDALAAIVGKGWVKDKSVVPVRVPSETMGGTGEGMTELAREVNRVGGEIIWWKQ